MHVYTHLCICSCISAFYLPYTLQDPGACLQHLYVLRVEGAASQERNDPLHQEPSMGEALLHSMIWSGKTSKENYGCDWHKKMSQHTSVHKGSENGSFGRDDLHCYYFLTVCWRWLQQLLAIRLVCHSNMIW